MTDRCSPGRRLLAESGLALEPCTLGAVIAQGDLRWGVTAGHALNGFGNGLPISYFPEGQRARLGTYAEPAAIGPDMDLAKFQLPAELVAMNPVGFGQAPTLFPEAELRSLKAKSVVFLGGQVGRIRGTVADVESFDGHTQAILVRLASASLIVGDSGGHSIFKTAPTCSGLGRWFPNRSCQTSRGSRRASSCIRGGL